jgi:hypothetical protein
MPAAPPIKTVAVPSVPGWIVIGFCCGGILGSGFGFCFAFNPFGNGLYDKSMLAGGLICGLVQGFGCGLSACLYQFLLRQNHPRLGAVMTATINIASLVIAFWTTAQVLAA